MERQINFYRNLYHHESKFISDFTKNVFIYKTSYTMSNVYSFVHRFNIPLADLLYMNKLALKRAIDVHYQNEDWKVSVIIDILNCLDGLRDVGLARDELYLLLNFVCSDR